MDSKELVDIRNEQVITSSLKVAKTFGKRHKDVMESIRKVIAEAENSAAVNWFDKSTYVDANNHTQPIFFMNRDGFTLLAMSFTGSKAMQFKMEYINAFNKMEVYIKNQQSKALASPTSGLDFLQAMLDNMKEQNAKIFAIESKLDKMEEERENATARLLSSDKYLSKELAPMESARDSVRRLVNDYSNSTGIKQQDVWHRLYSDLYYVYHIRVPEPNKALGEKSKLDVAQKIGAVDKIHSIISTMVYNLNKK